MKLRVMMRLGEDRRGLMQAHRFATPLLQLPEEVFDKDQPMLERHLRQA